MFMNILIGFQAFGKAFTEFISSFKPLAQMVTITGKMLI